MDQVFISYNHRDKDSVLPFAMRLGDALQQYKMDVWIDELKLAGGGKWQGKITEALSQSAAVIVAVSKSGLGNWGEDEVQVALIESTDRENDLPVTTVLLEDAPQGIEEALPPFLKIRTRVDLRPGAFNERIRFWKVIWSVIGGEQPQELIALFREYYLNPTSNGDLKTENRETQKQNAARDTPQDEPEDAPENSPKDAPQNVSKDHKEILLERAAEYYEDSLSQGNITFFLGANAACPPSAQEMTRELLADLDLAPADQNTPLLPAITTAGSYYAVKRNEKGLEQKLKHIITCQSEEISQPYARLVELLAELQIKQNKRTQRRSRRRSPQLIVTTNFDILLECALLRAGLRFTRIVQNRSGKTIQVDEYTEDVPASIAQEDLPTIRERLGESLLTIPEVKQRLEEIQQRLDEKDLTKTETEELLKEKDEVLIDWLDEHSGSQEQYKATSLSDLDIAEDEEAPSIVLYKFHGSLDVKNSCVISTDHYLNFIIRKQEYSFIPKQILAIIGNTPSLFLGYGPFDPDLLLTYYVMEEKLTTGEEQYAVPGQAATLWSDVQEVAFKKMSMGVLDEKIELFLERLIQRLQ